MVGEGKRPGLEVEMKRQGWVRVAKTQGAVGKVKR